MPAGALRLVPATPGSRPLAVRIGDLLLKKAESDEDLAQVHELNYHTFVREIGQHPDAGLPRLVDKFHEKNLYLAACRGPRVVAMLAVHDQPPFSITARLPDPQWIERSCAWPLEVRLLAVRPDERNSMVLPGLLWSLYRLALAAGYSHLLASGVRQQLRLYRRLGFVPLGPEVPCGRAFFTPLALALRKLPAGARRIAARLERLAGLAPLERRPARVSLLPGPPQLSRAVRRALRLRPISHRDPRFVARFERVRRTLGEIAGGVDAAMLLGSGTTANECVAQTLAAMDSPQRGLILVNGEFGERLVELADRHGLRFDTRRWSWGPPWRMGDVDDAVAGLPRGGWVWGVHCETSTGVLNPIDALIASAAARGLRVCLDCVSSFGSVPLDLRGAFLATAASGKCLGSLAGLAILLGNAGQVRDCTRRRPPFTLDAAAAFDSVGPRFTLASTLLHALAVSLRRYATPLGRAHVYAEYQRMGAVVRTGLVRLGARPLADPGAASPAVATFAPPMGYSAEHFGLLCRAYGFEINTMSEYLKRRGLVQIATMGDVHAADAERLFYALELWSRSAG